MCGYIPMGSIKKSQTKVVFSFCEKDCEIVMEDGLKIEMDKRREAVIFNSQPLCIFTVELSRHFIQPFISDIPVVGKSGARIFGFISADCHHGQGC